MTQQAVGASELVWLDGSRRFSPNDPSLLAYDPLRERDRR
jgi:hypothetical protein